MKNAEEILKELYCCEPTDEKQDLQLQITLNPDLDRILQAMHEYAAQDRWVKVSDRLPEENGLYLVYDINSPLPDKREIAQYSQYNKTWYQGADTIHPTHWHPLPTAPKD